MKFKIQSGQRLHGTINVSGSKNTVLKIIAATIVVTGKTTLTNVPRISDVEAMVEILAHLGAQIKWQDHTLHIDTTRLSTFSLPANMVRKLRGAVVFVGPLLARFKKAVLPFPGGCPIGQRPLTAHVHAFEQAGIRVEGEEDNEKRRYVFNVVNGTNKTIKLIERSVTATENLIIFAAGANSSLVIKNAAGEPEIDDLIDFLNKSGASIKRLSPSSISIKPAKSALRGTAYEIKGDRIEAGTWLAAGILLGDQLTISGCDTSILKAPIDVAKKIGADVKITNDKIIVSAALQPTACNIKTAVYPGFPTDLQSPFGLVLTQAKGKSTINETLFRNRLQYLKELALMGAHIQIESEYLATVKGPALLEGTNIRSTDLRAGATMVLAGLIASGTTVVHQAEIIDRGYEQIEEKLSTIGAHITRIK